MYCINDFGVTLKKILKSLVHRIDARKVILSSYRLDD